MLHVIRSVRLIRSWVEEWIGGQWVVCLKFFLHMGDGIQNGDKLATAMTRIFRVMAHQNFGMGFQQRNMWSYHEDAAGMHQQTLRIYSKKGIKYH